MKKFPKLIIDKLASGVGAICYVLAWLSNFSAVKLLQAGSWFNHIRVRLLP